MNIKNVKNAIKFGALFTCTLAFFSLSAPTVYSQASSVDRNGSELPNYCKKKAKKAKSACDSQVTKAIDVARGNCGNSKTPDNCITQKVKKYIDKASKGNPDNAKFNKQMDKALDDAKKAGGSQKSKARAAPKSFFGTEDGKYPCGGNNNVVYTEFNFGCLGPDNAPEDMSPIIDLALSIIRFLSAGVGIVIIGSMILAGIQYSSSEGNSETAQAAKNRIRDAVIGLVIYIFGFSLIQYLVPGGLFNG